MVVHNHTSGAYTRRPTYAALAEPRSMFGEPERTWTRHNHSPSKYASNWSLAWYRQPHFRQEPVFSLLGWSRHTTTWVEASVVTQARER